MEKKLVDEVIKTNDELKVIEADLHMINTHLAITEKIVRKYISEGNGIRIKIEKEGYSFNEYVPIEIGYAILDSLKITCDKVQKAYEEKKKYMESL